MSRSEYAKKLLDGRWQRFRLSALERANFRCEHCCDESQHLHVHHMFYQRGLEPWEYQPDDVVVLCDRCHTEWHMVELEFKRAVAFSTRRIPAERLPKLATILIQEAKREVLA